MGLKLEDRSKITGTGLKATTGALILHDRTRPRNRETEKSAAQNSGWVHTTLIRPFFVVK